MNLISIMPLHVDQLASLRKVDDNELVTIIDSHVADMESLRNKTYAAYSRAQSASYMVSQGKFDTAVLGLFTEDRKNFKTLMACNKKISESVLGLAEGLEAVLKIQEKFAQSLETLFLLGCENIAENKRVSEGLAKALTHAKEKGYSDETKERVIAVMKQLQSRRDVMDRIETLNKNNQDLTSQVSKMRKELSQANVASLPSGLNERVLRLEKSTTQATSGASGLAQSAIKTGTVLAYVAGFLGFAMGAASLLLHH
ncbi:hypothetical protein [Gluconobacter cerinus]|uniref:hypothetical protein n=1 Tax=Gluconobacter cerinus TaxID=38307 RepID=UPI002011B9A2|nr:hypothetical protein [Gluconobacter cerinus]